MNAPYLRSAPSGKSTVSQAAIRITATAPSRKVAAETNENSSELSVSASSTGSAATITVISRYMPRVGPFLRLSVVLVSTPDGSVMPAGTDGPLTPIQGRNIATSSTTAP